MLIKPLVSGSSRKRVSIKELATVGATLTEPRGINRYIAISHDSLDFPSAICQKAGSPRSSLPLPPSPSPPRSRCPFLRLGLADEFFCKTRRHRFKQTRRALLCQRPNRKSQLLRALPPLEHCLFLRFPQECFSTAREMLPRCSSLLTR